MTATPFVFLTSTEYARTAPDLGAVLTEATDDTIDYATRARMLAGIAMRTDITSKTFNTILKNYGGYGRDHFTLLANMLNNPLLARAPKTHTAVRNRITADATVHLIGALHNPEDYLPDMLLVAHRHSMFPDIVQRVRDAFTPTQIRAAADTLVEEFITNLNTENFPSDNVPSIPFLDTDHVDRIVEKVHTFFTAVDPTKGYQVNMNVHERALGRLLERADLTEPQGFRILDCIEVLALIERAQLDMYAQMGPTRSNYEYRYRCARLLNETGLPAPVLVAALVSETIRTALLSDPHTRANITGGIVIEAVRQGAPATLLDDYHVGSAPADVLDLVIESARNMAPTMSATGFHKLLEALVRTAIHSIGTPQWDNLYTLWTDNHLTADNFAELVDRRSLNWADDSTEPVTEKFAAWASTSTDPALRRHAVQYAYTTTQLLAATADPSPLVRTQVLTHPDITENLLLVLSNDADPKIRLAVATHPDTTSTILTGLGNDRSPAVRLAVVAHHQTHVDTIRGLARDTTRKVREAVAERFLDAFN